MMIHGGGEMKMVTTWRHTDFERTAVTSPSYVSVDPAQKAWPSQPRDEVSPLSAGVSAGSPPGTPPRFPPKFWREILNIA